MELKDLLLVSFCVFGVVQSTRAACTAEEQEQCKLPDCLCPSVSIPGDITSTNIPQIVYLTFDDAINIQNYPYYRDILFDRKNPNGHSITMTFFTTHEYNDYSLVHDLWTRGNDIALHSITHQTNTKYWQDLNAEGWRKEIVDQQEQLAYFARIPIDDIQGLRAPFLQTGGDTMMGQIFGTLKYDCSRPTRNYVQPGLWPYTMDFDTKFQDCQIAPCATEIYPGFWNVPMVDLFGGDLFPCAMIDTCLPQPNTTESTLALLKNNFLRHYEGNRAPFGVFTHAAWLADTLPGHKEGYIAFLDYLATLDDVYIVSVAKGLEWVKNPTTLDTIKDFAPWHVTPKENLCKLPNTCRFAPEDTPGFPSERYMTSCVACPRKYPWYGNPLGEDTVRPNKFDRS